MCRRILGKIQNVQLVVQIRRYRPRPIFFHLPIMPSTTVREFDCIRLL